MSFEFRELRDYAIPGGIQTGPFGSQLKAEEYRDSGVPVVMPKDMSGGRIIEETAAKIPEAVAVRLKRHRCEPGDILFARRGEIGRLALIRPTQRGWICGTGCLRVRPNSSVVAELLAVSLQRQESIDWLIKNAVGQTMLNLNTEILASLPIALPPEQEQRKIADILTTWDQAMEKIDIIIDAKQRRKTALLQRLLKGEKRLKGFDESSGNIKSDQYGSYPADWRRVHLGEVTQESNALCADGDKLPVFSCTKHRGLVRSDEYFGRRVHSDNVSSYRLVKRGEFAYATNHIEEGSIGYQNLCDAGLVSPIYTVFKTDEEVDADFFFRLLKSPLLVHLYRANTSASVNRRGSLRYEEFAGIHVWLPKKEEQSAIASVLNTCDDELRLLRSQRAALEQQKRGLMQRLLTGKIRVKPDHPTR